MIKKIRVFILTSVLSSSLYAGELRVRNNATAPIGITVMAKESKNITNSADSFVVTKVVQSIIIPSKENFNSATFAVQGATTIAGHVVPIVSNECVLNGDKGIVVFTSKSDGSLVCVITQVNVDYSSLNQQDKRLVDMALQATQKSYAPYSSFYVGSALETMQGNIFIGCNIENASYGAANCAERTAIFNAIAHEGKEMKIKTVVALCKNKEGKLIDGCSCGICRQVISEFATAQTRIIYQFNDKITIKLFKEIFPDAFTKESLEVN